MTEKTPVFIELSRPMSEAAINAFQRGWEGVESLQAKFEPVFLSPGMTLANEQSFRPAQLNVECGSISINVNRSCFGVISVDGVPLKVRSADIHLEVGESPSVKLEIVP